MEHFSEEGLSSSCFVATVCFGNPNHPTVEELRDFREQVLKTSFIGRCFIKVYYVVGPYLANGITFFPVIHSTIRQSLRSFLWISRKLNLHHNGQGNGDGQGKEKD